MGTDDKQLSVIVSSSETAVKVVEGHRANGTSQAQLVFVEWMKVGDVEEQS